MAQLTLLEPMEESAEQLAWGQVGTVVDMVDQDEGKPYLVEFAVLEGRGICDRVSGGVGAVAAALPVYGCLLLESTHFLLRVFDNIPAVGLSISSVLFRLLYINSPFRNEQL